MAGGDEASRGPRAAGHDAVDPRDHGRDIARVVKAAEAALEKVYGVRPLIVRMGGTVPMAEYFQRLMGLSTLYFSFSTGDEDFHAPNEFFRVHRLHEGLAAWAHLWEILSRSGR